MSQHVATLKQNSTELEPDETRMLLERVTLEVEETVDLLDPCRQTSY